MYAKRCFPETLDLLERLHALGSAPWTQTRSGSLVNVVLRLLAWPLSLGIEIATLPERIVWEEPPTYNPRAVTTNHKYHPSGT